MSDNIVFLIWLAGMSCVYGLITISVVMFLALVIWLLWPFGRKDERHG